MNVRLPGLASARFARYVRFPLGLTLVVLACGALPALTACDLINTPSKVANGQLYESGDGKYDPYFATVHQEQVTAGNWPEESKNARKPIIVALNLRAGASNPFILSATREKKGDAAVGRAVDETVASEHDFAKRLLAATANLTELHKRGEELRKEAIADKKNLGADKADEKKVAKRDEVKREVSAALDAVETMLTDAQRGAREADELASKLKGAWTGKDDTATFRDEKKEEKEEKKDEKKDEKKEEKKKPEPKKPAKPAAKPDGASKPEVAPAPKPAAKPDVEPKAAPPPKPPDEVFNP